MCPPAWTSSTTDRLDPTRSDPIRFDSIDLPDPELLTVGRVTKAHGLRGEVVVQLWTDQSSRLDPETTLASAKGDLTVVSSKPFGEDRFIVQFAGVHDRTAAERLRGVELEAEPIEVEGALWVHELVGATVLDAAGTELGSIASVEANPASDLLVLESGGLIPATFITAHESATRTVRVDIPEGLLDP